MPKISLLLLLWTWGCGVQPPSQFKASEERLVVVLMGGRNSCGADKDPSAISMYPQAKKFLAYLEDSYTTVTTLSCYDIRGQLYYKSNFVSRTSPKEFTTFVNRLKKDHLLLIGHSYGGWLAMATANESQIKSHLYTIDPISPQQCALGDPTSWLGCQRAPQDLDYESISRKTHLWSNFFQTTTKYLHSSQIPKAQNIHIENVGHTEIDNHDAVWSRLEGETFEEEGSIEFF